MDRTVWTPWMFDRGLGKTGTNELHRTELAEVGPELGFMLWQRLGTGVGEPALHAVHQQEVENAMGKGWGRFQLVA